MKEINLRMLTRLYNGQRYLPNILPNMDEVSGPENTLFYSNGYTTNHDSNSKKLPEYTLSESILVDDVELDMYFKRDYRDWLEKDVYSTDGEDDEDEDDEDEDDGDFEATTTTTTENDFHIGTPVPDTIPIPLSAQDLTNEINKLYIEELRREFEEKQKKQEQLEQQEKQLLLEQDGWGSSPSASSIATDTWGSTEKKTAFDDIDDEDADEMEPEFNPLQDIDWGSLTKEDLEKRLSLVEQKTVQRWLNVEMDDERYLKVLNTYEGEVLTDEEGWPI